MRKFAVVIAVIGAGLACAAMLYGENQPATTDTTQQQSQMVRVKDLLGSQVINPQSQSLGKIEDVVINADTGKVRYGILTYGGMAGMGEKYVAAPWSALRLVLKGMKTANGTTADRDYFVLDISSEALKDAPSFDNSHWPNFADMNYDRTIEHFYSEQRAQKNQTGSMTR
jgi:sporulation protein YlmC with PRC-barrel domain